MKQVSKQNMSLL